MAATQLTTIRYIMFSKEHFQSPDECDEWLRVHKATPLEGQEEHGIWRYTMANELFNIRYVTVSPEEGVVFVQMIPDIDEY